MPIFSLIQGHACKIVILTLNDKAIYLFLVWYVCGW